jgi:hypothetical protein
MANKTSVTVSGPGWDRKGLPTVGAGISNALSAAGYSRADGTWYVREGDTVRYHVDRRGSNIFVTERADG